MIHGLCVGRIRFYQGSGGLAIREFPSAGASPELPEYPLKGGSDGQGRVDIYISIFISGQQNRTWRVLFLFGLAGGQFAQFPETCFHARHLVEVAIIRFKRDLQLLDCRGVIALA